MTMLDGYACRVCGTKLQDRSLPNVAIRLWRCPDCRLRFNESMFEQAAEPVAGFTDEFFASIGAHPLMFQTEIERLLTYLRVSSLSDLSVVDVGCGAGLFLDAARRTGAKTIGVEANESMCEAVQAKGHACYLSLDAALSAKLKTHVVYCSHTLEHFLEPRKALASMHQLLAEGGILSVTVPCLNPATYLLEQVLRRLGALHGWGIFYGVHMTYFSRSSLVQLIRSQGFVDPIVYSGVMGENFLRKIFQREAAIHRAYRYGLLPLMGAGKWFGLTPNISVLAHRG